MFPSIDLSCSHFIILRRINTGKQGKELEVLLSHIQSTVNDPLEVQWHWWQCWGWVCCTPFISVFNTVGSELELPWHSQQGWSKGAAKQRGRGVILRSGGPEL